MVGESSHTNGFGYLQPNNAVNGRLISTSKNTPDYNTKCNYLFKFTTRTKNTYSTGFLEPVLQAPYRILEAGSTIARRYVDLLSGEVYSTINCNGRRLILQELAILPNSANNSYTFLPWFADKLEFTGCSRVKRRSVTNMASGLELLYNLVVGRCGSDS